MDLSTMIVDLLRNSKEEKIMAKNDPYTASAYAKRPTASPPAAKPATPPAPLGDEYEMYKREALASGEPAMSREKFKEYQARMGSHAASTE